MKETKLISLCGEWSIAKDPQNNGCENGWQRKIPKTQLKRIYIYDRMPSSYWTMDLSYSNIFPKYHGYVWYYKTVSGVPEIQNGERVLLEFERAGYVCEAFVNGVCVGEHRDHEKKFAFDVTDAIRTDGENLVAVRCFEPRATGRPIDGLSLQDFPNGCFGNVNAFMLGCEDAFCLECIGGILGAVHLRVVPCVCIEEVYVRPFYHTGEVDVTVLVKNTADDPLQKAFDVVFADKKAGTAVLQAQKTVTVPVGESEIVVHTKIENHRLWELDQPFLYLAAVSVDDMDMHTASFGFKDFRVQNGFFFLNGKRIFLKGAHCAITPAYAVSMKALGFNLIRTITRSFTEETLDICDEIGLLVLDAALTAWGMPIRETTREQVERYNINMIRRHRNHPSVAAYCLFNEEEHKDPLFYCGADALPLLRRLAPDTLFLLHSGRWDHKNMLGSASNPGSDKWDTYLGAEGREDVVERIPPFRIDGYNDLAMGDVHVYPTVPISAADRNYFRTVGHNSNPLFISESGIASQGDPMGEYLSNCNENLSGAITIETAKQFWDEAEEFLDFYDLRDVYPVISDFSRDTERLNGTQRTLLYNIFRSNPMINGFSFTSFGVSNEGALQGNLVVKDSLAYAIQQGHEPLRWAMFTEERTVYSNKSFGIEAVLCNEDVLKPGSYAALAYVHNQDGCVWKKHFTVEYPEQGFGGMPPLAVSALREEITLPAGEYVFSARLLDGGAAYDGDWKFTVAENAEQVKADIAVYGVSEEAIAFLGAHGVSVHLLAEIDATDPPKLVLVGCPNDTKELEKLHELVQNGCNIVFADIRFFMEHPDTLKQIVGEDASVRGIVGTIYHHDHICKPHPLFAGVSKAGAIEFDQLGAIYPENIFQAVKKPSQTVCAAIRMDSSFNVPGLSIGEYDRGDGRYVLNNFRMLENIGKHPFADLLLCNFVKHYGISS